MASNANDQDVAGSGPRQRRQQGIKRACNECRQQKLRCDVVSNPFQACSRCRRLRLVCKIDAGFKRVEKRRAKHARQQVEAAQLAQSHRRDSGAIASPPATASRSMTMVADEGASESPPTNLDLPTVPTVSSDSTAGFQSRGSRVSTYPTQPIRSESEPSVSSGRLRSSSINKDSSMLSAAGTVRVLGGVELDKVDVDALLKIFFTHYYQFLPFLEPSMGADFYYRSSRLLFWAIMSVASRRYAADLTLLPALAISVPRLMWSALQRVTQNYNDVKALCLLCMWPFPRSSSASDPTFMLSGALMSVAMQLGLHKPHQPQDFSQFTKQILPDELQDRITTWAACKIVSQRVATGCGQSLALVFDESPVSTTLSNDMQSQLRVESLCAQISKTAFVMSETMADESYDRHLLVIDDLARNLARIELEFADQSGPMFFLYLNCARLHLRLHALHQPAGSPNYIGSALSLYDACNKLILIVESSEMDMLSYCPNYVYQMIVAAGFAVLRLSTSPIIKALDASAAKKLFNSCISAVRKIGITNNDLPGRSAEVLAQLKARRNRSLRELTADWNSVRLKVRGRSSMSISYDSLWEWRGGFVDDEHISVADNEVPNSAVRHDYVSPHAERSFHDDGSAPLVPTDHNFALNDMNLDQFYPWMLENSTELSNLSNLNSFTT